MENKVKQQIWVAVRVERGFPVEVKGFRNRASAELEEQVWRSKMNPDYDETEVLPLTMADPQND